MGRFFLESTAWRIPTYGCPGTGLLGSLGRINGLFHLPINGIFSGVIIDLYSPLILSSWDIQVPFWRKNPDLCLLRRPSRKVFYMLDPSLRIQTSPDRIGMRVPIPSEKNRNVGVIPFLGHTWIVRVTSPSRLDFFDSASVMVGRKSKNSNKNTMRNILHKKTH